MNRFFITLFILLLTLPATAQQTSIKRYADLLIENKQLKEKITELEKDISKLELQIFDLAKKHAKTRAERNHFNRLCRENGIDTSKNQKRPMTSERLKIKARQTLDRLYLRHKSFCVKLNDQCVLLDKKAMKNPLPCYDVGCLGNLNGKIIQVIDDSNLLLSSDGKTIYFSQISTQGLYDGRRISQLVVIIGRKQYTSVTGATQAVPQAIPLGVNISKEDFFNMLEKTKKLDIQLNAWKTYKNKFTLQDILQKTTL